MVGMPARISSIGLAMPRNSRAGILGHVDGREQADRHRDEQGDERDVQRAPQQRQQAELALGPPIRCRPPKSADPRRCRRRSSATGTDWKKWIVSNSTDKTMPTVVRMATVDAAIRTPSSMTLSTGLRARKRGRMRRARPGKARPGQARRNAVMSQRLQFAQVLRLVVSRGDDIRAPAREPSTTPLSCNSFCASDIGVKPSRAVATISNSSALSLGSPSATDVDDAHR